MTDSAIELRNVDVTFRLLAHHTQSLKEHWINLIRGAKPSQRQFCALRDVSLSIRRGESLGVIGKNGAGKSTLLRVMCRVIEPTGGSVEVRGPISPVMDIQTGFVSELTGLENIYLMASILGVSKAQIEARVERIVEFSGLHEFIDTPVRTYSLGMRARLGFSVATDISPEILVIDEVLAVGDCQFRAKCFERIQGFRDAGATIVLVSHNLSEIERLCDRALWLERGRIRLDGAPARVAAAYSSNENETGLRASYPRAATF